MACTVCGVENPTGFVCFRQMIGIPRPYGALGRLTKSKVEGELCRACIGKYFSSYTLTTLFLGWWCAEFAMAPIILVSNVVQYLRVWNLPKPRIVEPSTVNSVSDLLWKFGYGIVMWGIVALAIAWYKVDFMHRHAPAINAALHSDDASDDARDARSAFMKISKDVEAIDAGTNSSDWDGYREELLARARFFEDVSRQNMEFQSAAEERDQALVKASPCGEWVADDLAPALNSYAAALSHFFIFVKNTPALTRETRESFQVVGSQEQDAMRRLKQAYAEPQSQSCR